MAFVQYIPDETNHATISLPDDSEIASGIAAFNTPLEQLADKAAFAIARMGSYRVVSLVSSAVSSGSALGSNTTDTFGDGIPVPLISSIAVLDGDKVEFAISFAATAAAIAPTVGRYRLAYQIDDGAWTQVEGTLQTFEVSNGLERVQLTMLGLLDITTAGSLKLRIEIASDDGATEFYVMPSMSWVVKIWRGIWRG